MKNNRSTSNQLPFYTYPHDALRSIGNFFGFAVFSLLLLTVATPMVFAQTAGKIAFEFDDDLYTMNADGTMRTLIYSAGENESATPDWSPDGSRIVFQCENDGFCIIKADGTGFTTVPNTGGGEVIPNPPMGARRQQNRF